MVQIKNRITGLYDRKGMHGTQQWTMKPVQRGAWGTLGQAKSHIAQFVSHYYISKENIMSFLNADFIILDDEYAKVEIQPVSDYLVPKIKGLIEEYQTKDYRKQEKLILEQILDEFKTI